MNYMKMVDFIKVGNEAVTSRFIVKENERRECIENKVLVPNFLILEAIFQTAGKVAREFTNNVSGGTIVSFKNLNYVRPIFTNEITNMEARLISYNKIRKCLFIKVKVLIDHEVIIKDVDVIIMQDSSIKTDYLNNTTNQFKENILNKFGY